MKLLLMRLEGPLQSYGIRSRWMYRDTYTLPTKSAIIGILGCCMGYSKNDIRLEVLDKNLIVGVRCENRGDAEIDFQTIKGKMHKADRTCDEKTIVSYRTYLHDAAFLAVIGSRQESYSCKNLLDKCIEAVKHPVWPVYLGRKCCIPVRPLFEAVSEEYDSIETALKSIPPWERAAEFSNDGFYDAECQMDVQDNMSPNFYQRDEIKANVTHEYGLRPVIHFKVKIPLAEERK